MTLCIHIIFLDLKKTFFIDLDKKIKNHDFFLHDQ